MNHETFHFQQGSFGDFLGCKLHASITQPSTFSCPEETGNKTLTSPLSFHLHSFTVHQRESTQPDTQGLFPSVIQQVLRPDRKPVFHSTLPCLIAGYF